MRDREKSTEHSDNEVRGTVAYFGLDEMITVTLKSVKCNKAARKMYAVELAHSKVWYRGTSPAIDKRLHYIRVLREQVFQEIYHWYKSEKNIPVRKLLVTVAGM